MSGFTSMEFHVPVVLCSYHHRQVTCRTNQRCLLWHHHSLCSTGATILSIGEHLLSQHVLWAQSALKPTYVGQFKRNPDIQRHYRAALINSRCLPNQIHDFAIASTVYIRASLLSFRNVSSLAKTMTSIAFWCHYSWLIFFSVFLSGRNLHIKPLGMSSLPTDPVDQPAIRLLL